ncbi:MULTISPECIES: aminotransferase [Pseudomonas]|uniref:aminotransferase n=1 Tax=Pseudomonas TaxID=286 RepID=UPI0009537AF3|nr:MULTISPECIES: aminotransferase [Pseudomonas]MDT8909266.1 aminotransferase [Pseudomonas prosekii]ROO40054.1 aminotransferase [Pseudomonas sp. 7SR1]SIS26009.1 4-aminobutyrate---pyruvate transaminase [Pseudomonas sp. 7SR1]
MMQETPLPLTELARTDVRFHLHSQTNLRAHQQHGPLVIERGSGIHVTDEHGRDYIEGMSGLWCAGLGFSNARLVQAAQRQMSVLPYYHTFNHRVPSVVAQLAERIACLVPFDRPKVFFACSGSEANDSMIKLAWAYHRARGHGDKRRIIAHQKGFHGSTVMGASLSGLPNMHAAFGLPLQDSVLHVQCPHFYRYGAEGENEAQFTERLLRDLEQRIEAVGADSIAAFISEPVMGAGGVIVPPPGYFAGVQAILKKHDILFLADEIICGFGRTGQWFGHQTLGFAPDMMACAKSLSSGYQPISCVVVAGDIYTAIEEQSQQLGGFGHGFTYSGHPVAAAVALETLTIYEEMRLPQLTRELGSFLHQQLEPLLDHSLIGEIRGVGLVAGLELVADKRTRASFPVDRTIGVQVERACRANGLIVRNMGDSIALAPPFIITAEEIVELVARLKRALDTVALANGLSL